MRELSDKELEAVVGGKAALPANMKPAPSSRATAFRPIRAAGNAVKLAVGNATGNACAGGVCPAR